VGADVQVRRMLPYRLPRPLRLALYALATAILLYLCLAPSKDLPKVNLWDKEEHAIAWLVLTATGLLLSPWRPRAIAAFAFGVGVFVEAAQWAMGFGRDADWHDVAADCVGIVVAFILYAPVLLLARPRPGPHSRP
jgi:VanZ family protein